MVSVQFLKIKNMKIIWIHRRQVVLLQAVNDFSSDCASETIKRVHSISGNQPHGPLGMANLASSPIVTDP